jgi:hypothetical protein
MIQLYASREAPLGKKPQLRYYELVKLLNKVSFRSSRQILRRQYREGLSSTSFGTSCMVLDGIMKELFGLAEAQNVSRMRSP